MVRRKPIDEQPGPPPKIWTDGKSVTFEFDSSSGEQGARLVIRCEDDGNVIARIAPVAGPDQ